MKHNTIFYSAEYLIQRGQQNTAYGTLVWVCGASTSAQVITKTCESDSLASVLKAKFPRSKLN